MSGHKAHVGAEEHGPPPLEAGVYHLEPMLLGVHPYWGVPFRNHAARGHIIMVGELSLLRP